MRHPNVVASELDATLNKIDRLTERDNLTSPEVRRLKRLEADADALLGELVEARKAHPGIHSTEPIAKPTPRVSVGREARTFTPDGPSYFSTLYKAKIEGDFDARDLLQRHKREVEDSTEYRDLNRTDTTGGEFVPPAWLIDEAVHGLHAGRVAANLVQNLALPGGTDSLNIPKATSGATVAAQTADNATVNEVDLATTSVNAPVRTFAGQNDVAVQLLEQSPIAGSFDRFIFDELVADLNRYTDAQVINGSGAAGQFTGILQTSNIGNVDYQDADPTVPEIYPKLVAAKNLIEKTVFAPADAVLMHVRRWSWFLQALDSGNRPFVTSTATGPHNALGVASAPQAEGAVGSLLGVPVYVSANIPITLGGGTEDVIVFGRFSDAILFEGPMRMRVMPEPLSGTLTVRVQLYRYSAFTAARHPESFCTVSDTGLAAPSGL